ncbi:MAG: hypothetical protein ABIJ33_02430 [Patescibacteria group bacterium]|nr:O-antigen ligase family protein [Patescibacteria group bacterium]
MFSITHQQKLVKIIAQVLLVAWLIYLPVNLFWKFDIDSAYVNGRLVDYLIPKIFVTDILMVSFVLFNLTQKKFRHQIATTLKNLFIDPSWLVITFFFILLGLGQFFAGHQLIATMTWMRLLLITVFGLTVFNSQSITKLVINLGLGLSILIQTGLGLWQFFKQIPLAPYWVLGESRINQVIDIAKFVWQGQERVLAYGSTAHPNILAGVAVVFGLWLMELVTKSKLCPPSKLNPGQLILSPLILQWLILSPIILVLIITQSWSAGLGLLIGWSWLKLNSNRSAQTNQKAFSFLILVFLFVLPFIIHLTALQWSSHSLARRDYLNQSGLSVWQNQPILGVGLSNITAHIEEPVINTEVVRFVQPPHQAGLVWLSETGLIGLFLTYLLIKQLIRTHRQTSIPTCLVALLPIAGLDHYLLTTQTGLLLLLLTVLSLIKLNHKQ